MVIGELVPKALSLQRAERVSLMVARPFQWYLGVFSWLIDSLDGLSGMIIRALGVTLHHSPATVHSAEELQMMIQQARERGLFAPGEEKFILGAIELGNVIVREIMVPRPDVHAASRWTHHSGRNRNNFSRARSVREFLFTWRARSHHRLRSHQGFVRRTAGTRSPHRAGQARASV